MNTQDFIGWFQEHKSEENIAGKQRFGIEVSHCYGVSNTDLRTLAKGHKKNHALALELWETGSNEAKILATYVESPAEVTEKQMEDWVKDIHSWDVCDSTATLFVKTTATQSDQKIFKWANSEVEFIKRMAFSMIAVGAVHQKKRSNEEMQTFFPLILEASIDPRNFVKKAVNWALRQLGKRNMTLCKEATKIAQELMKSENPAQAWIGKNAYKELTDPVQLKRIQNKGL